MSKENKNTPDKVIQYIVQRSEVIKKDNASDKNASDRFLEFVIKRQASS